MSSGRPTAAGREAHLVELVDETGLAVGARTVDEAHRPPGLLHRAFSVVLVDPAGRLLLQQRAAPKTRFPLRWANSCCGHPAPGQSLAAAANRRLGEELGIAPLPLTELGVYLYRAQDPETGRIEFEYDHVLRGDFGPDRPLRPDPDEIADLRWVRPDELRTALENDPQAYAPWLGGVLDRFAGPGTGPLDRSGPGTGPSARPGPAGTRPTRSAGGPAGNGSAGEAAERSGGR